MNIDMDRQCDLFNGFKLYERDVNAHIERHENVNIFIIYDQSQFAPTKVHDTCCTSSFVSP